MKSPGLFNVYILSERDLRFCQPGSIWTRSAETELRSSAGLVAGIAWWISASLEGAHFILHLVRRLPNIICRYLANWIESVRHGLVLRQHPSGQDLRFNGATRM